MTNDQHKFLSHDAYKDQNALSKRLIFKEGSEKASSSGEQAPETKKESLIHDLDFDKKYLDKKESGTFNGTFETSIAQIINSIKESFDENERSILITDLHKGLEESVAKNLDGMSLAKFGTELLAKGCEKIRLHYNNATDTLEFQFLKKNGEKIIFNQKDITVQYVPRNLNEKVEYEKSRSTEAFGEKKINSNKELKELIPAPQAGDMIIVTRADTYKDGPNKGKWYESKIKCIYDAEKKAFVVPGTKHEIYIYRGNKVAYLPNSVEKAQPKLTLKVGENELPIVAEYEIQDGISYSKLAEQILSGNGGGIVQPDVAKIIQETLISRAEYAALLKAAHEANGKTDRLPIVIPNVQAGRKSELRKANEEKEFAEKGGEIAKEAAASIQKLLGSALVEVRTRLDKADQADFDEAVAEFKKELPQAIALDKSDSKNQADLDKQIQELEKEKTNLQTGKLDKKSPIDRSEIPDRIKEIDEELQELKNEKTAHVDQLIADFVEELDNNFSDEGKSREVNPDLADLLDDKKAWDTAWREGRITGIENLKAIVSASAALKKFSSAKLRDTVYNILEAGDNTTFNSMDVMKGLDLGFPAGELEKYNINSYSELQGLAAMVPDQLNPPKFKDPSLDKAYQAAISIVQPVEAFAKGISEMKIEGKALTKKVEAGKKGVEVNEKDPEGKRQLAKLIQVAGLNLDSEITNFDTEGNMHAAKVNLQGRQAILEMIDNGFLQGWTVNVKDRRGALISSSSEKGHFDVEGHVDKVRNAILGMSVDSQADTSKMAEVDYGKQKYGKFSINQLEKLSGETPGISWKEFPSKVKSESIYKGTTDILRTLGALDSAYVVDEPDNLREFNENDEVRINLNYKGQPLTMKVTNGDTFWRFALAKGYNQTEFKHENTVTDNYGLDLEDDKKELEAVFNKLPEYALTKEAIADEPAISVNGPALSKFNEQVVGDKKNALTSAQLLETIFQVYTFAELVEQGVIRKVKGKPNEYVLFELPESFTADQKVKDRMKDLAFAVKQGKNISEKQRGMVEGAREKAREGINANKNYLSKIGEIFGKSATLNDTDGRRVTMEEIDNTGAKSDYIEDIYFQTTSGAAANDRFLEKVLEPGTDKVNVEKANTNLNMLYQKGLKSLRRLAGTSEKKYQDLYERFQKAPELKNQTIDLKGNVTDFQKEVIRLGYLQDQQETEVLQKERIAEFRAEMAEKMGPELANNAREKGAKVTDEEVKIALNELPVSFLLGCQVNTLNETVTVGAAVPIMLPINENFTFVITPGAGGIIGVGANNPEGGFFGLTVGLIAKTDLPGKVGERFTLIGGIHAGLAAGARGGVAGVGPVLGAHGGVEFQFTDPRDPEVTTRYFAGLHAGVGLALDTPGVAFGGYFRWQDDVQALFNRDMKEHFAERELTTWIDQYNALTDKKPARDAFANKLKADSRMSQYLNLSETSSTENTIMMFERYISEVRYKFASEEFDPGVILGGTIGIGMHHIIMPPLWFVDVLGGLKINIGKDVVSNRSRKTSEEDMEGYGELNRRDQLDQAFNSIQGTATERSRQIEKAGKRFLDSKGQIRVSESETTGGVEKQVVGPNLAEYNKELVKAGLKLVQDEKGRIEVQVLPDITEGNTRFLIGPNIAVRENGKTYLKSPNSLTSLYAHRFDKTYPFEVSHGATKLSVIILSDNRFFSHQNLPREIELTKFKGDSAFSETLNKSQGSAEAYSDKQVNLAEYQTAAQEMDKVLSNGEKIENEVRDNLDKHAKKLYSFVDSKKQTFLSITDMDGKKSKKAPAEFSKETLYTFFDEYAEKNKEKPFSPVEKEELFLELTEMRYVELTRGYGQEAAYQERLNWAKNTVLIPYFKERIKDIGNPPITMSAEQLAQKAIDDIKHLSVSLPASKLDPFTSAATALGRQSDGMHMILKIGHAKEYGYVTGKDYSEALKKKDGSPDYQLALVLKSQIEALPKDLADKANLDRFMRSSLAMKTASLDGLTLILGLDKFNKVKDYYAGKEVSAADLQSFTDLIRNLETARDNGELNYVFTNEKGQKYIFLIRQSLKSGVFQKCANYTITYNDEVAILPPEAAEAMQILASQGQAVTTVDRSVMLQFNSLFGGVIAGVNVTGADKPPGGGGGNEPEPEGGQEGEVKGEAAPKPEDRVPTKPGADQVTPGPSDDAP
jgi:hypothetical protein